MEIVSFKRVHKRGPHVIGPADTLFLMGQYFSPVKNGVVFAWPILHQDPGCLFSSSMKCKNSLEKWLLQTALNIWAWNTLTLSMVNKGSGNHGNLVTAVAATAAVLMDHSEPPKWCPPIHSWEIFFQNNASEFNWKNLHSFSWSMREIWEAVIIAQKGLFIKDEIFLWQLIKAPSPTPFHL